MTKSDQIALFILNNKPRRKELTKFIVVDLNKICTSEEFDANPSKHRGYYGTNMRTWQGMGNVVVKNGRYQLTKQSINNNLKLYSQPIEEQLKDLKRRNRNLRKQNGQMWRKLMEFKRMAHRMNQI